jgi:hypothetical protein
VVKLVNEILRFFFLRERVHCRILYRKPIPTLYLIVRLLNPAHTLPLYFCKTQFNTTLTPNWQSGLFISCFLPQLCIHFLSLACVLHVLLISQSFIWSSWQCSVNSIICDSPHLLSLRPSLMRCRGHFGGCAVLRAHVPETSLLTGTVIRV